MTFVFFWKHQFSLLPLFPHNHPLSYPQHQFFEDHKQFSKPYSKTSFSISDPHNSCSLGHFRKFYSSLASMIMSLPVYFIPIFAILISTNSLITQALIISKTVMVSQPYIHLYFILQTVAGLILLPLHSSQDFSYTLL